VGLLVVEPHQGFMELKYSIKELHDLEVQVLRSIGGLQAVGTLIGEQHHLSILKNLIEENRQLREELLRKNTTNES
jgi:hypothetical protein